MITSFSFTRQMINDKKTRWIFLLSQEKANVKLVNIFMDKKNKIPDSSLFRQKSCTSMEQAGYQQIL